MSRNAPPTSRFWLEFLTGPEAGRRHPLQDKNRLGRGEGNELCFSDTSQRMVSGRHAEIVRRGPSYVLRDLQSTNGTRVDGGKVSEIELQPGMVIELGRSGPRLLFGCGTRDDAESSNPQDETLVIESRPAETAAGDDIVMQAVSKARRKRAALGAGHTAVIMREAVSQAVGRSSRKLKVLIAALVAVLVVVVAASLWQFRRLSNDKVAIDEQLRQVEQTLSAVPSPQEAEPLMADLERLQGQAEAIRKSFLYRIGARSKSADFIDEQIHLLMTELGAPQYSIPPEFRQRVVFHAERYRGPDRSNMDRALNHRRDDLETMREAFRQVNLPADLALMALVESAFRWQRSSAAGAAGPWQFVAPTARAFGLQVDDEIDERFDVEKSTAAAARYLKQLILDFGAGQSVLLALAAYNLGPSRVRRAVRRVDDPFRQRDFWYLYRTRALPPETREYIPKIVAAILVARNPEQFGFEHDGVS